MGFLLFINSAFFTAASRCWRLVDYLISDRSVESARIKRAIEGIYNGLLPKGTSPWVYLRWPISHSAYSVQGADKWRIRCSLKIEPSQVDVNVHPTKREACLSDESPFHPLLMRFFLGSFPERGRDHRGISRCYSESSDWTESVENI
jgi:DNA mismatch repair ATPase MutL